MGQKSGVRDFNGVDCSGDEEQENESVPGRRGNAC